MILDFEVLTETSTTPEALREIQEHSRATILEELASLAQYVETQSLWPMGEQTVKEAEERYRIRQGISATAEQEVQKAERTLREARAAFELIEPPHIPATPEEHDALITAQEKIFRAEHICQELRAMLTTAQNSERDALSTWQRKRHILERIKAMPRPETPLLWSVLQHVQEPKGEGE